ncbi:MAG: hypothetical protein HQL51_13530 [Magnetococcales bacterium]|nr:hypothetical protein [Magnetococcales bacterium]
MPFLKPAFAAAPQRWIFILLLAGLALAAYHRVGTLNFVNLDDPHYLTHNPMVAAGLSWEGVRQAFSLQVGVFGLWMPLTWLSLMLDVSLFGMNPGAMHGVNLFFHVLNVILLFHLALRLIGRPWAAFFAAALFAVHPQHVEAVAWVTERKELLSTLFGLMALRGHLRYVERPSPGRMVATAGWFFLSLSAKPMWAAFPLLLLLLDLHPLGRRDGGRMVLEKFPLFLLAALFSVIPLLGFELTPLQRLPVEDRLAQTIWAYAEYFRQTLAAWDLSPYHPYPDGGIPWSRAMPAALALAGVLGGSAWLAWRGRPWFGVGVLGFMILLLPVSGLIQGGQWVLTADRYSYPAHAMLFVGATAGAAEWLEAHPAWRRGVMMGCGLLLLLAMLSTWRQVSFWRDGESLWTQVIRHYPQDSLAWFQLGNHYLDAQRPDLALAPLTLAVERAPGNPHYRLSLALARLETGNHEGAAPLLQGLRKDEAYREVSGLVRGAMALTRAGRLDEADAFWERIGSLAAPRSDEAVEAAFQRAMNGLRRGEGEGGGGEAMRRFFADHPETAAKVCGSSRQEGRDGELLAARCRESGRSLP